MGAFDPKWEMNSDYNCGMKSEWLQFPLAALPLRLRRSAPTGHQWAHSPRRPSLAIRQLPSYTLYTLDDVSDVLQMMMMMMMMMIIMMMCFTSTLHPQTHSCTQI